MILNLTFNTSRCVNYAYSQLIYYLKVLDYLLQVKPDVVHAHDLTTLPIAGIYKLLTRTKFIYDSQELEMHRNSNYLYLMNYIKIFVSFYLSKLLIT